MITSFSVLTRVARHVSRGLLLGLFAFLLTSGAALAAAPEKAPGASQLEAVGETGTVGAHATAHEGKGEPLPQKAPLLLDTTIYGVPIKASSSTAIMVAVALLLIISAQLATRRIQEVPEGAQNFWEWLVESLYNFLQNIVGPTLIKKTFWFFATIFIFILALNWFSLIPGVGTIGWGVPDELGAHSHISHPILRGPNADLNMTLAMAMAFFIFWTVWALRMNGVGGFLMHLFAPKAKTTGLLRVFLVVVFIGVGFLEIITILIRPVALCFRLFGNIYAGEYILEVMTTLGGPWFGWLFPIPFYFLEILVGLVQALVFMLLCAIFTLLIMPHEEAHH